MINRFIFTKRKRILSSVFQYLVIVAGGLAGALMLLHGLDALVY